MIQVVLVKNPFEPGLHRVIRKMGDGVDIETLKDEFAMEGLTLRATVNGGSIEDDYVTKDGDYVVLYPSVEKGGKKLFGIIAMVALTVFAGQVGIAVDKAIAGAAFKAGTALSFAAYAAQAAVMFIGGALISHFTPKANNNTKYGDSSTSQTYSWGGTSVMEGQNNPVQVVYGKVKTSGQSIGKYVSLNGDKEYLNWLISAGQGELAISDIRINDNPYSMYPGVSVETRSGTNDQSIIPYFNDTYFTKEVSRKLGDSFIVESAQGNATQGLIVAVEFPNGLYYANDKGGLDKVAVGLDIMYRSKNGGWLTLANPTVEAAQSNTIRRQYRIDGLTAGEYEIQARVFSRTHNGKPISEDNSRVGAKCYLSGVTSIVYDDFTYPNKALVAIRALATDQLSGSPNVSFMVERSKVWVWNPITYAYEQRNANNPAWAAYDYIHQARRLKNINTGRYEFQVRGAAKESMLYDQFKAWADFCDKKKLYINWIDDTQGRVMDKVNEHIAPIGRGYVLWFGTKCGCVWDSVREPVQMFTMGNIVSGTFQETFSKTSDRANCVEVTYTDANADYTRNTVTVYGETYDTDDEERCTNVTYDGITDYAQAVRTAKYLLACNQYLVRTISFEADIDSIACQLGDCIAVAHDVPRWGHSGRIYKVDATNKQLTLPVELDDLTKSYQIMYRKEDDSLHTIAVDKIVSSENGWTVIEAKEAFKDGQTPEVNDIFDLGFIEKGVKLFTVNSITRASDMTRKIEALEYNENIYSENYTIPPVNYSEDAINLQNVISLHASQAAFIEGNTKVCRMYASWTLPYGATPCKYDILLSKDGKTYTVAKSMYGKQSVELDVDFNTKYWLKVVSVYGGKKTTGTIVEVDAAKDEPEHVTNVRAWNRYRTEKDSGSRYDIVVQWDKPNGVAYDHSEVWYKTDNAQLQYLPQDMTSIGKVSEAGYAKGWTFGGNGVTEVVIPQAVIGDTYQIAVIAVDRWGAKGITDSAPKVKIKVAMKTALPNTPSGFTIRFGDVATVSWKEVVNSDIAFYEVRRDANPGRNDDGLLARTNDLTAVVPIKARTGTLYLYAKNAHNKYSYPAILDYNKPVPAKPDGLSIVNTMSGINVYGKIPADCLGMTIYVDGKELDEVRTTSNTYSYVCGPGIYDVQVAYYDMFGEGEKSAPVSITIKIVISQEMIEDEAISLEKVDKTIQDAVKEAQGVQGEITELKETDGKIQSTVASNKEELASQITQTDDKVTSVVTELSKDPSECKYSAITQLNDGVNLRVVKGDVINQINLTSETTTIDGKFLHVTGDSVFDNNIISSGMIQSKAVTADKISVNKLSAITANVGSLTGGTITGTQLIGADIKNSTGSFHVDANGNIWGTNIYSGTINADMIWQAGYQIHANSKISGEITSGQIIPLPAGYSEGQCVWGASPNPDKGGQAYLCSIDTRRKVRLANASNTETESVMYGYYWCIGFK